MAPWWHRPPLKMPFHGDAPLPKPAISLQSTLRRAWRLYFRIAGHVLPGQAVKHAIRLFITPRAEGRSKAKCALPAASAAHRRIYASGHAISVYIWGEPWRQPYVLLVHGWSGYGLELLSWVAPLRALGYAVVAFDQPGHGLSGGKRCSFPLFVSTLQSVAKRFGDAAVAVGHSLGGAALVAAQCKSWRAQQLILLAPPIDLNGAIDRFARIVQLRCKLRRDLHAALRDDAQLGHKDLQLKWRARGIHRPGLIVHDIKDKMVPWSEGACYAQHWRGARLLLTQGLGHLRILHSEQVIKVAMAFLCGANVGVQLTSKPANTSRTGGTHGRVE